VLGHTFRGPDRSKAFAFCRAASSSAIFLSRTQALGNVVDF
jgi:hypothetical protein